MAKSKKSVDTLRHKSTSRTNIPTAELESIMAAEDKSPVQVPYARRNRDLDNPEPQNSTATNRTGPTA